MLNSSLIDRDRVFSWKMPSNDKIGSLKCAYDIEKLLGDKRNREHLFTQMAFSSFRGFKMLA